MTFGELHQKDVINVRDGRSLGHAADVEFCPCDGSITAIIVPGEFRMLHLLRGERSGIVIPWSQICKIGDDVVLVDVEIC